MIINGQAMLTDAVLSEIERAPNPRFRDIMSAAVRHLHDFVREARLSEIVEKLTTDAAGHIAFRSIKPRGLRGPWYSLHHNFVVQEGAAVLPPPPVTGKAIGDRPTLVVLDAFPSRLPSSGP